MGYKINPKIEDKDKPWLASAAQDSITKLKGELIRLSRLPYADRKNMEKIISVHKQMQYLEEFMSAYEKDLKKHG